MKKALITGIAGQDGPYLAELLLEQGYTVLGVTSRKSSLQNLASIADRVEFVEGDIADEKFVHDTLSKHAPDEVYNLSSFATVARPWESVEETVRLTALAPLHFLEGIRAQGLQTRFFQASSAEMFGAVSGAQDEESPFNPRNPYGVAKVFAHHMVRAYRRNQGLFAVSGILFNHESPRRKENFVMRKITASLARIKSGTLQEFSLGDLESRRDWGFAGDYVRAMHLSLQAEVADEYVIATGTTHSVRDIVEIACTELNLPLSWEGEGLEEHGVLAGKTVITIDKDLYRPGAPAAPYGNIAKAQRVLGWKPACSFEKLVSLMAQTDFESAQKME